MLNDSLTTNEVKNALGNEIEFTRWDTNGRSTEFQKVNEVPNAPHRLKVSHLETGKDVNRRRRSLLRFDMTNTAGSNGSPVITSAYIVLDIPIGNVSDLADAKLVLANLMSLVATTGAASTVLFDGTGNGALALLNGTL